MASSYVHNLSCFFYYMSSVSEIVKCAFVFIDLQQVLILFLWPQQVLVSFTTCPLFQIVTCMCNFPQMSSSDRASWDPMTTKIFIDLCIIQKNLNNFNSMGLTKYGWQQVYRSFREQTGLDYDNKKLQNKLNLLRRSFQHWQYLQNHTGLGLEPTTSGIAADNSYWGTQEGVHCSWIDYKFFILWTNTKSALCSNVGS